ncbi:MAG: potassium channel family protein [Bacillota bacterium]
MYVVVVGGGKVGYYLVKTLVNEGHTVCLIERYEDICAEFAREFGIMAINGDGTHLDHLEEANLDQDSVIAAVTGKDEENLVICQLAKRHLKVRRAIARVNNPKNVGIFEKLGVDVAVSSTSIIANLIENEVTVGDIKTLLTFQRGDMAIVESEIPSNSPAVNVAVKNLGLPEDSVLVSIIREGNVIIPRGNTIIRSIDSVVALTSLETRQELSRVLIGR